MSLPFIGYGRQSIDETDIQAVTDVLRGDFLTQGPAVERFEAALAERVGARYAVAVNSGTAGLHIACLAAGIQPGELGLTSAITFAASANCLLYCNARAALVDINPVTLGMDLAKLQDMLAAEPDTRIVIPVHMAGYADDMAALRKITGDRIVIEDASHALGGTYADGSLIGSCRHSDMTIFSFHPVKTITTGEGGAVTTNDPELARRLRLLRSHGIERDPAEMQKPEQAREANGTPRPWYYEQQMLGYNYRLCDIQAALGTSQIARLDHFIKRRRDIAFAYDAAFRSVPGVTPLQADPAMRNHSGLHLYIVAIDFAACGKTRTEVMQQLRDKGIGTQVHYIPVYRQPYHQQLAASPGQLFPASESYYQACLSLPLFPDMTDADIRRVVGAVETVLA